MTIDPSLLWSVTEKVLLAFAGGTATYLFEKCTRLLVFFGHVGFFRMTPPSPGQPAPIVHTHSVIIRNAGRLPANNVKVPHNIGFAQSNVHVSVNPDTNYKVNAMPGQGPLRRTSDLPQPQPPRPRPIGLFVHSVLS